jgi:hypothetical protein
MSQKTTRDFDGSIPRRREEINGALVKYNEFLSSVDWSPIIL